MKWEINRVSTPERIFDKINNEMAQPVGIVLFGADCDLKDDVLKELEAGFLNTKIFHGAPSTHEMVELIHCSPISIFVLSWMESCEHELRHECVKVMRNIGAKTVVGVYVKAKKKPIPFGKAMISVARDKQVNQQIDAIEQSNPTADGLDYLLVVSEEE